MSLENELEGYDGLIDEIKNPNNYVDYLANKSKDNKITIYWGNKKSQTFEKYSNQIIIKMVAGALTLYSGHHFLQKKPNFKAGFIFTASLISFLYSKKFATLLLNQHVKIGLSAFLLTIFHKEILKTILTEKIFNYLFRE